jgi:ketosteroid isomerase-like protein
MSANLDLVRTMYKAFERGDFTNADWADPAIEYVIAEGPEPRTFRGLAGLAEAMRNLFGDIEEVSAEAEEYRELDAGHVLVLARAFGRGTRSGLSASPDSPFSLRFAEVFEVHGGQVTRIVVYYDRERALADLGLEG